MHAPRSNETGAAKKSSPPCLGGVAAASADGVVVQQISDSAKISAPMPRIKPNHPSERPKRNDRPNNRPYLQTFRTQLRSHLTPAEARLWKMLKNSQLDGRKFRRQHSVGDYIVDFYCPEERLAIELDGQVHKSDAARQYDADRQEFLKRYGIKVIRFENFLVFEESEFVLNTIRHFFRWWNQ